MGLFEPSAGDFWETKEKEEKEKARKGAEERERAAAQAHRADAVRRTVANYEAGLARYRNVMDLSRNNIEDGARRLRRAGAFERGADAGLGFSGGDKALSPDARAGADFARRDTRPTDAGGRTPPPLGFDGNVYRDGKPVRDFDAQRPLVSAGPDALSPEERELYRRATTPYAGALNGQLTAAQLNAARGIVAEHNKNAAVRELGRERLAAAAAENAANREAVLQKGRFDAAVKANEGALNREMAQRNADRAFDVQQAELGMKRQGFEMKREADALELEDRKRIADLTRAYGFAKSDGQRGEIARQIDALNGKFERQGEKGFDPNVFKTISYEVADPDTGLTAKREGIVDLRTGKPLDVEFAGEREKRYAALGFKPNGQKTASGKIIYENEKGEKRVEQ
ncbi:hypothetical protein IBX82_05450 [Neisseria gonorrhoeae]|nr:hypothetical protein IBX82_05450 [Neisseria gonorrhoeae]